MEAQRSKRLVILLTDEEMAGLRARAGLAAVSVWARSVLIPEIAATRAEGRPDFSKHKNYGMSVSAPKKFETSVEETRGTRAPRGEIKARHPGSPLQTTPPMVRELDKRTKKCPALPKPGQVCGVCGKVHV